MRTPWRWCGALAGAALLAAAVPARGAPTAITLIHVNDSHSKLDAWGPNDARLDGTLGGLTKAATIIGLLEKALPNPVLVHAGDAFHGELFFTHYLAVPEFEILSQLGLQAFAVGNHEFELGPDALVLALGQAATDGYPVPAVSANLDTSACPPLPSSGSQCALLDALVKPYRISNVGGVRIGFFGLTISDFVAQLAPPVVIPQEFAEIAAATVKTLRDVEHVDLVVCLAHVGLETSRELAKAGLGIDVVVQGHDHDVLRRAEVYGNSIMVSAGAHYGHVGALSLVVDPAAARKVRMLGWKNFTVDGLVPREPSVKTLVASLELGIGPDYFDKQLGWALGTLSPTPPPGGSSSAIGNFVSDAYRARTGTDIAIEMTGFAEEPLYFGPINGAGVFRVMSYGLDQENGLGFKLATFRITGANLVAALETALAIGQFPAVSGMTFTVDTRRPDGGKILLPTIRIRGQPLDPAYEYTLTTNEAIPMLLAEPPFQIPFKDLVILENAYTVLRNAVVKARFLVPDEQQRIVDLALQ